MKFTTADGTEVEVDGDYFTADELEKARREAIEQARREERDKLYGDKSKQKEQFDAMQAELAELRKAEQARERAEKKRQDELDRAKQAAAEAELSAKELLEKRQQEWEQAREQDRQAQAQQLAELKAAQEAQAAIYEKQREMDALQIYIRDAVAAASNDIAPELLIYINGDSKEQVDASIEQAKQTTARILEGMRQAQVQQRAGMPGVSPSGGATALTPGIDTGDKQLTAEDIKGMSMADFRALRERMGMPQGNGGRGIFG